MKVAATIIGCHQVSPEDFQTHRDTYVFPSTVTIDEILKTTGQTDISCCNLASVTEPADAGKESKE